MMETVQLWLYIATATLLVVHEIDSAFWKEWELLSLPFGHQGFVLVHVPLVAAVLFGVAAVMEGALAGAVLSLALAGGGLFAFVIHSIFIQRGRPEFTVPVSRLILFALLISSVGLAAATVLSLLPST